MNMNILLLNNFHPKLKNQETFKHLVSLLVKAIKHLMNHL